MAREPTPKPRADRLLYARIAGGAYLAIVLAAFMYAGLVESQLVVPGDDALTAAHILAHPLHFRFGIVLVLLIYASVVIASWALYLVLRDVHESVALLALLFRMAEAILGATTILVSFAVLSLLGAEASTSAFSPAELTALAGRLLEVRTAALDIVLLFIGVGATLFCYLLFRTKLVPRLLAGWGIFTYLSMFGLALVSILVPDHPQVLETVLYSAGGAFELLFGLWLLVKGVEVE